MEERRERLGEVGGNGVRRAGQRKKGTRRDVVIRMLWLASIGKDSRLTKSGKCIEVKQCVLLKY